MTDLSGFPYCPLEFNKDGGLPFVDQKLAVLGLVRQSMITDLIILSHGWNNDMAEAGALYSELAGNLAPILMRASQGQRYALAGVLWPSKKFTDDELMPGTEKQAPGGAASADGQELDSRALKERLERLKGVFDRDDSMALDEAKALVDQLEDSPRAQREFVDKIRSVLPRPSDTTDDASDRFFAKKGDVLLGSLKAPVVAPTSTVGGGAAGGMDAAGGAAGIGDFFGGIKAAAWRLLNYTTYYQMKERAGVVGQGLNGVLSELQAAAPSLRIHLVGHSFGARVVTAAAKGPEAVLTSSLTLLQGAFSHNGFASRFDGANDGFFRQVITERRIVGPIVVTHTVNDKAVGTAYPIASRISGDNRLALGDENDPFGGIGRNGAVKLEATEVVHGLVLDPTAPYQFEQGRVHNLRADGFIRDHGDVANSAVANVVAHAVMMT